MCSHGHRLQFGDVQQASNTGDPIKRERAFWSEMVLGLSLLHFRALEVGKEKFCSRDVVQAADGSMRVGQPAYFKSMDFVPLGKLRKEQLGDANVNERTAMTTVLGALGYLACESRPDLSGPFTILQSRFNKAQVSDIQETNRVAGQGSYACAPVCCVLVVFSSPVLFSTSSHRSPSSPSRCSPQSSTRGPGPTPCATSAWGPWSLPTMRHPSHMSQVYACYLSRCLRRSSETNRHACHSEFRSLDDVSLQNAEGAIVRKQVW